MVKKRRKQIQPPTHQQSVRNLTRRSVAHPLRLQQCGRPVNTTYNHDCTHSVCTPLSTQSLIKFYDTIASILMKFI